MSLNPIYRFMVLLICLFALVSGCKKADSFDDSSGSTTAPISEVEVVEMDVPTVVSLNEESEMNLTIKTFPNEKVFYTIKEKEGNSEITPNSGIIFSQEDVGNLVAKLNAKAQGSSTFTLTLTNSQNQSVSKTFTVNVQ